METKGGGPPTMVVGLDFGTTFSGTAFALSSSGPEGITIVTNWESEDGYNCDKAKAPTRICYRGTKEIPDWGYGIPPSRSYHRWFKLLLIDEKDMPTDVRASQNLMAVKQALAQEGRTAVEAISDYLRELWGHTLENIAKNRGENMLRISKLDVVVTVPAIWPHYARLRMKSAIEAAGILDERSAGETSLAFISEPEAAVLAALEDIVNNQPDIKVGDSMIICDAGGGTMDIITYTVVKKKPFTVCESVKGDGKLCGAIFLDQGFNALLKSLIHRKVWDKLGPHGIRRIMNNEWENWIKPSFSKDSASWEIPLPFGGTPETQYRPPVIRIRKQDLENIYKPVVGQIEELVESQARQVKLKDRKKPKFLILVGGFGKSKYLYDCLKELGGKQMEVLQSSGDRPWTAICRGAVLKAMELASLSKPISVVVNSRISRASYGTLVNILPFDVKEHDPADRTWCDTNQAWLAAEQTRWFVKIGEQIQAETPIGYSFWQDMATPKDENAVDIVYSDSLEPPCRKDATVKTLCVIKLSNIPNWHKLPKWTNMDGEEFRRISYELRMLSDGASLDFYIYHKGKQLGCQNVAIEFMDADSKTVASMLG